VKTQVYTTASLLRRETGVLAMLAMMGFPLAFVGLKRPSKRAGIFFLLIACASVGIWTGCGGGGGTTTPPPVTQPAMTPAGTYTLSVTATAGSTSVTQQLKLSVQ